VKSSSLPLACAAFVACSSAPAATVDFFGPTVEPPRGLGKLHPGISVAEAERLVPGLHEPEHKGVREELLLDSGTSDVTLEVRVDAGTVSAIVAIVQGHHARDLLEHAWGKPEIARDSLGQPEVTWSSEASGWKVKLDCLERNCLVEYTPFHVLTAEFFGAHVVPPGELSKLRIGMKLAEAKLLAPGPVSVRAGITTGVDGVREFVAIDDKLGTVRSIYLNLPPHAEDLIAEAWGPGSDATEPVGRAVKVWPDPETGWRATLRDALGYSHDLAFENYIPAAQLFGDEPDLLDGLPDPVLGRPVDEVKHAYRDFDVAQQGHDLVVTLPPTEWDRFSTRITLAVAGTGTNAKVHEVSFAVPWKGHPEARDTLFELFKKKWGEPKEVTEEGKNVVVFREEDPRVEVREDDAHGAWQIVMK
jgi:hypothetical protein